MKKTNQVVNPLESAKQLSNHWSPKVIGEVDDNYVKVAKLKGEFCWHDHENEDELFFILNGTLKIEIENEDTVHLKAGDMYVIPKGVRHNPIADEECHVLLFERKSTLHTGDVETEQSKSIEEQLA